MNRASQGHRSGPHRGSVSRIVPAIPHALDPKARRAQGANFASATVKLPIASPVMNTLIGDSVDTPTPNAPHADSENMPATNGAHGEMRSATQTPAELEDNADGAKPSTHELQAEAASTSVPGEHAPLPDLARLRQLTHPPVARTTSFAGSDTAASQALNQDLSGSELPSARTSMDSAAAAPQNVATPMRGYSIPHSMTATPMAGGLTPLARPSAPAQFQQQPMAGPHPGAAPFIPGGGAHMTMHNQPHPSQLMHDGFGPGRFQQQEMPMMYQHGHPRGGHIARHSQDFNGGHRQPMYYTRGPAYLGSPPAMPPAHGMATPSAQPPSAHEVVSRMGEHMVNGHPQQHAPQMHNQAPPFAAELEEFALAFSNKAGNVLGGYLHSQFQNPEYADWHVRVTFSGPNMLNLAPIDFPAHGVIMARSPKLRSLMTMSSVAPPNPGSAMRFLHINVSDPNLRSMSAFMKAFARLYADQLPSMDLFAEKMGAPLTDLHLGNLGMQFAVSFAAAGHFLQVDEIISHGLEMILFACNWDTIGKALAFGLDGGLSSNWAQRDPSSSSEDRGSTSSMEDTPSKLGVPNYGPTYGFYSDQLLKRIIEDVVEMCPEGFRFSSAASQLPECPRLPGHADHNPRTRARSSLSRIRFGEMSLQEETVEEDFPTKMLSSVLLTVPFQLVKFLLEHPGFCNKQGAQATATIMRAVINEREVRRERAQLPGTPSYDPSFEGLAQKLMWTERVESSTRHPSGARIVRKQTEPGTPTSSGSLKT